MDATCEVSEFLRGCRSRLTPDAAGLVSIGHRRVVGLRRDEVAVLAGVSTAYYRRLERGQIGGASDAVLNALARALQLDAIEREHLFALARAAVTPAPPSDDRRRPATDLRPAVRQVLDAMVDAPALVRTPAMDVLGANTLGRALFCSMFDAPERPANVARFVFLNPAARRLYGDWPCTTRQIVAALRAAAFQDPQDQILAALIDELSARSAAFRLAWADHEVRHIVNGIKVMHHPVVGTIQLDFERFAILGDDALTIFAYSAAPRSEAQHSLMLLGSWAATEQIQATTQAQQS